MKKLFTKVQFLPLLLLMLFSLGGALSLSAQGKDDFHTSFTSEDKSRYSTHTSTAGWVCTNAALVSIDGTIAPTINGKTTAVGTITSPKLEGGIGTLTFKYANTFKETKGVSVHVSIMQEGKTVKEFDVVNTSVTQNKDYTYTSGDLNIEGEFTLVIKNNSPSKSTSNKDRVSIWGISWDGYGEAGGGSGDPSATNQTLSFSNATVETYASTASLTANPLSGAMTNVSYQSSNEAVATVNADGDLQIVGAGSTTITATAEAGTVGEVTYNEGKAGYVLHVYPTTVAGIRTFMANSTTSSLKANLTNAVVTYTNGSYAFLEDASGAIMVYSSTHGLSAGECYTGEITMTTSSYNGLAQLKAIDPSAAEKTTAAVEPTEVNMATLVANFAAYESMFIKLVNVTTTGAIASKNNTTTLTQDGVLYESPVLRAVNGLTSVEAGGVYDILCFPGVFNTTNQLNVYADEHVIPTGAVIKADPALAFASEEVTIGFNSDDTYAATSLSDATITYTYTVNPEDADIDADPKDANGFHLITRKQVCDVTVTASVAETSTYKAGEATLVIHVVAPAANISPKVIYRKVTSNDAIVDGGVYLLVCESKGDAMADIDKGNSKRMSTVTIAPTTDAKGVNYYEGSVNEDGAPYELTAQLADDGTYYLLHGSGKYLNATSSADISLSETGKAGWSFAFVESTGNVRISHSSNTNNYLQRNSDDSNKYIKNYAKGQSTVQLYQKVGEMTLSKAVNGHTTYVADFAYSMPASLKGAVIEQATATTLKITDAFSAGDEVPALTPLLVKTAEAYADDETAKAYYPAVLNKSVSAYTGENFLEYQRAADGLTTTSAKYADANCSYYKLAVKDGVPGFYMGNATGAAFQLTKGSTAYLTVPKGIAAANGFTLERLLGSATGIQTIDTVNVADAPIYNLQGQRIMLRKSQLPQGLYIVGGKKVLVK